MSLTSQQGKHPLCLDHLQRVKDQNQHAQLESSNAQKKWHGKGRNEAFTTTAEKSI